MRRRLFALAVLVGAAPIGTGAQVSSAEEEQRPPSDHVIMISIDGLRPEFYLQERWPAPSLRRMATEGAHAEGVRGVFPTVTYPSHATLVTGALPARHGIYYNLPFEPDGQTGRWYWAYDSLRVETLWDAAREAGLTTAAVTWPVTVDAPIDWNVPEYWSLDPDEAFRDVLASETSPDGWLSALEREATGTLIAYDAEGTVDRGGRHWWDGRKVDMAEYVIGTRRPSFMAMHLTAADDAQHEHGREHWEVDRAVQAVDHAIGVLVEAADRAGILGRTTFLIVGDHGFIDYERVLHPNVWLVEAGLTGDWEERGDWSAAFHAAGGFAALHLRDPDDDATLARVRGIVEDQPDEVRHLYRLIEEKELRDLGADPRVRLALSAERGTAFNAASDLGLIEERQGGTHGYWPDFHPQIYTGFVAWGAGIRSGARLGIVPMEDIAPLAAALLGLDLDAPDGRLPETVLGAP